MLKTSRDSPVPTTQGALATHVQVAKHRVNAIKIFSTTLPGVCNDNVVEKKSLQCGAIDLARALADGMPVHALADGMPVDQYADGNAYL